MKKPKVGILTTFSNFHPKFSLANVVRQQLLALNKHGYETVLFILDIFKDDKLVPKETELRKVIPQLILEPYAERNLDNFDEDVGKAQLAMEEHLQDIDVCLTHDIIFINSYLSYNEAMRRAQETTLTKVKFLHWMHSAPSARKIDGSPFDNLFTLPKNSKLVYMNYTDVVRAAEMYGIFPKDVETIFNPMDIRELYNFSPITKEIIEANNLMKPDFLCIYPLSTTRMNDAGKQLSKVVTIMAELKKLGRSVALVVPNADANADNEKTAIENMHKLAKGKGLERKELIFTSLHDVPKWELGVPHRVVQDLFLLGNLFIFPSVSENCPLILLEAMAGKNILILNKNFPAMKDFAQEAALYFEFGSLVENVDYHQGIDLYMKDVALIIQSEFENNKAIKSQTRLRQTFNLDAIFRKQLEPAIQSIYQE